MKLLLMMFLITTSTNLLAVEKEPRQLARKLYISLTGVTPTAFELNLLEDKIASLNAQGAALDIIDQRNGINNNGAFYNATVKDMVTPWTNKANTTLAPLNDMSATIIGWIRDDKQFNQILYADSVYRARGVTFQGQITILDKAASLQNADCNRDVTLAADRNSDLYRLVYNSPTQLNPSFKKCRLTKIPYFITTTPEVVDSLFEYNVVNSLYVPEIDVVVRASLISASNEHYESISEQGLDLADPRVLKESSQEGSLHKYPRAISGLLSTRSYGAAYLYAGTNRAAVAFAVEHFMCKDMEALNDITVPDFRNRRDVDRSPGGTSDLYKNRCIGCHAGMDALAGAFAYYDYVGSQLVYTPGTVVRKMNHNVIFPEGFSTQSDNWINLWTQGQNASLKWGAISGGDGVKSLGMMLSETEAFHSCMAKQVYEKVCNRKAVADQDKARIVSLVTSYKESNYNMKKMFINASISCMGD